MAEVGQEPTPEIDEITPEERRKTTTLAAALAAAGGLVLLISLVLPWYKDDVDGNLPEQVRSGVDLDTYTAFSGLERTDVLLAIVAIAAIAAAAAALTPILRDLGLLGWTPAIGVAAALLVIYRGSERPEPKAFAVGVSLQFGWYLALLSSLVVVAAESSR